MEHFKKRPAWVPTGFDQGQPTWKPPKPVFYEKSKISSETQNFFKDWMNRSKLIMGVKILP